MAEMRSLSWIVVMVLSSLELQSIDSFERALCAPRGAVRSWFRRSLNARRGELRGCGQCSPRCVSVLRALEPGYDWPARKTHSASLTAGEIARCMTSKVGGRA